MSAERISRYLFRFLAKLAVEAGIVERIHAALEDHRVI